MRSWAIVAALLLPALAAHAAPTQLVYRAGDVFEIRRDSESSQRTTKGSTGSSSDRDTIMERIVGTNQAGLELEYDLPKDVTAEDRARQWQFPARVLKPSHGPLQLLNRPELEVRATAWLKAAGLTQAACGHWYFTWNAFRVDCDPQSVIETIEGFDSGPDDLSDGAQYRDSKALNPAPLKRKAASPDGAVFFVEMAIDPDAVRRDRAEADVVVAEIMRKPLTLEAALHARSAEYISGAITMTFETDPTGHVRRRTKVTTLNITGPDGRLETQTVTETLERRLVSRPSA
jgi:hypothetical protein